MSLCGLLIVNHDCRSPRQTMLDAESWHSVDCWVVATQSEAAAKLFQNEDGGAGESIAAVIVNPNRAARYQLGLEAAARHGEYIVLCHPGESIEHLQTPEFGDKESSARLAYVDDHNRARWRRMLVKGGHDWNYDIESAELILSKGSARDVLDKKSRIRENSANLHVQAEWRTQLNALLAMHQNDQSLPGLNYEIGLSFLRLEDPSTAYDWFASLRTTTAGSAEQQASARTMMANINKTALQTEALQAQYQQAVDDAATFLDAHYHLADSLYQQGAYQAALDVCSNWQDSAPSQVSALDHTVYRNRIPRLMAQCHSALGNYADAVRYYNYALSPNDKHYRPSSEADSVALMHTDRDQAYQKAFPLPQVKSEQQNHFKIIVAFWNAADYLQGCVDSIARQQYCNYEVIFVDDVSTDGGLENVDLSGLTASRIVHAPYRRGPLHNQVAAVLECCDENDIVVVLDGDDTLAAPDVLRFINNVYTATDCWASIGQFKVNEEWRWGYARPILPNEDISEVFRNQTLRFPVHLRTHRAGLFHRLCEQDPSLSAFKNQAGEFFFYASDVAYCRAALSLSGAKRIRYIPKILMDYNVANPRSVHHNHREQQSQSCIEIAQLPPLNPLETYLSD